MPIKRLLETNTKLIVHELQTHNETLSQTKQEIDAMKKQAELTCSTTKQQLDEAK